MCKSTYNDPKQNYGKLDHSGGETNIGLINLHYETVNHDIKMISILLALVMVTIIVCKCVCKCGTLYDKCFMKQRDQYMEFHSILLKTERICCVVTSSRIEN